MKGHFKNLSRWESEHQKSSLRATSPLGLRPAVAKAWGARIVTPSITACPPTEIFSMLFQAVFFLEALHPPG